MQEERRAKENRHKNGHHNVRDAHEGSMEPDGPSSTSMLSSNVNTPTTTTPGFGVDFSLSRLQEADCILLASFLSNPREVQVIIQF